MRSWSQVPQRGALVSAFLENLQPSIGIIVLSARRQPTSSQCKEVRSSSTKPTRRLFKEAVTLASNGVVGEFNGAKAEKA